jgi:hypothetical protein
MSTVKELVLSPVGTVAEPLVEEDDEDDEDDGVDEVDEDDEQAAAVTATAAASATQPSRVRGLNVP